MYNPIELTPSESRVAPLTFQQRFLFAARRKADTLVYFDSIILRLSGKVRPDLLLNSFEQLIRRHDALRTRLVEVNGSWVQKITGIHECQLRFRDISDGSDEGNEELAKRCLDEFTRKRWSLDDAPLYYVEVLKVSERRYFLSQTVHHLIYDATSLNLMFREIWSLYAALVGGRHLMLAEVPFQYSDYAIRQQREQAEWRDKHDLYWQAHLDGASRASWPGDGGTAGVKTCATALARVPMDATLSSRLREFARRERILPSLVTLAAYIAVVSRQCDQRNFVLPMSVAGRYSAEEATLVGYLSHFLFLRIELTGNERFMDLLGMVKRELTQAMLHQDSGRISGRASELMGGIFFNWIKGQWRETYGSPTQAERAKLDINVEPYPAAPLEQVVNFKPMEREGPAALLSELGMLFLEERDSISTILVYRADLYSAAAAARALTTIPTALAKFLRDPYAPISAIALNREQ